MPKFLLDRSRSRWTRVGIPWQRAQGTSRHNATTTKVDRTQPQHNSHLQVSLICVENLKKTTELVPTTICGTCRRQKPMGFHLVPRVWKKRAVIISDVPVDLPVARKLQWASLPCCRSCNKKTNAQHETWESAKVARAKSWKVSSYLHSNQITPFNSPSTFSKMFSPHISDNLCMKIVMWSIAGWMSVHSASILTGSDRDENMTGLSKEMMTYPSQSNSMNKS